MNATSTFILFFSFLIVSFLIVCVHFTAVDLKSFWQIFSNFFIKIWIYFFKN